MKTKNKLLGVLFIAAYVLININAKVIEAFFQPEPIGAYLDNAFPSTPPSTGNGNASYTIEDAFPNVTFKDPLKLVDFPGDRYLIIGKSGQVWLVDKDPSSTQKSEILNIRDQIAIARDAGLLGVALHPNFDQAGSVGYGEIYFYYRYNYDYGNYDVNDNEYDAYLRLTKFNFDFNAQVIDPNSESVLIQQFDRHVWHNGGDLFFGQDGFLYFTVGDEGGGFTAESTQQIDNRLFGGLFRIDVDMQGGSISHPIRRQPQSSPEMALGWPASYTQGYFIPSDNPWLSAVGAYLEEYYAIGLRSPHRASQDPLTGKIWIGDVGSNVYEEINAAEKGDNMQWPYMEGDAQGSIAKPSPLTGNEKTPAHQYGRTEGRAVIGGYVIRGNSSLRYPELADRYIYGDHEVQNVWTFGIDSNDEAQDVQFLLNVPTEGEGGKDGISSFSLSEDGTIFILDLFGTDLDGGKIHKLVRQANSSSTAPLALSEVGAFTSLSSLEPSEGLIPYDVNSPLWSDGATKKRWIVLPNDGVFDSAMEQIKFSEEDNWEFPEGTVTIKHFELPIDENNPTSSVRLETRFFIFTSSGGYGLTYRWNEEGTEAFLIDGEEQRTITKTLFNGTQVSQNWTFPSRQQCMDCHNQVAGYALGLKTRQLNGDFSYPSNITSNQLGVWNSNNVFDSSIGNTAQLPKSAGIDDANTSVEHRVRSYIDANCGFCHRPNGVDGIFDGRSLTGLCDQSMLNAAAISNNSTTGTIIVRPGDAVNSLLKIRDESTGPNRMPPIGREIVDQDYIDLLTNWINGLNNPIVMQEGYYTLKNYGNNNVLTSTPGGIQLAAAQSSDEQKWKVEKSGGHYTITSMATGLSVSTATMNDESGENIVPQSANGKQNQKWYLVQQGSEYQLTNAYNGLVLDGSNPAQLKTTIDAGIAGQLWDLQFLYSDIQYCSATKLTDLSWNATSTNGWGPIEVNMSNGPQQAQDGNPMVIAGKGYAFGLGTHANAEVKYDINGGYDNFSATVGIDDSTCDDGAAIFRVFGDGQLLFDSGSLTQDDNDVTLEVTVTNVSQLRLVVDSDGVVHCDHANWANPILQVLCTDCTGLSNTTCDDGDPCTFNDSYDNACNCIGTYSNDSDNDGICDSQDQCPGFDDNLLGQSCNDNDPCTINDIYANCGCQGTHAGDSDNDGICDGQDQCPNLDDNLIGTACDDNNPNTVGEVWDANCNCTSTQVIPCSSTGTNVDYEYIQAVSFGSINNMSGANGGYSDFTSQSTTVDPGSSYPINLTPGFASSAYSEHWAVWMDFNRDGDFSDAGETVYSGSSTTTLNGQVTIPTSAQPGGIIMRVAMQYNAAPPSCGSFTYGEVEDYTVMIQAACTVGQSCDDGSACTTADAYDSNCNCVGTPVADLDGDGVCDALDACPGFDDGLIGTACNDNDPCTTGEIYDTNCGCSGGVFQDTDSDGVCDAYDQCPGHDDNVDTDGDNIPDGCDDCSTVGQSCNDGDTCTTGDIYDSNCNCVGTPVADSDGDGVCDALDACPGFDDGLIGTACNDNDPCTTGEIYDTNCGCSGGAFQDTDSDGVCDANDQCPGHDDNVDTDGDNIPDGCDDCTTAGQACNDGDPCTANDTYNAACNCIGTYQDSDNDGVCDANDQCPGYDDAIDTDADNIPDGCDNCTTAGQSCNDGDPCTVNDALDTFCNCIGTYQDSDGDGVCDANDQCPGLNDALLGTACDDGDSCTTNDTYVNCGCQGTYVGDSDSDGICDSQDQCPNLNDNLIGTACNDNDPNTVGEVWDTNCNCKVTQVPPCSATSTNVSYEYIQAVSFGNINNVSGANGGYADFTNLSATVDPGSSYAISLTPGFAGSAYNEHWAVWMDFNRDGDFSDAGETVYSGSSTTALNGQIIIPASAQPGGTIMRVAMQYNAAPPSCGSFTYGEVEDYTMVIQAACTVGQSCDDGDACTTGDTYDSNCNCVGTPVADSDGDGVCDALDACPGFDDGLIGTACNDNDSCTTGETYDTTCGCSGGAFQDTDSDGVCDANDQCPGYDDNVDTDGDNIPDGCDDCSTVGQSCDDGDACTIADTYDSNCNCVGTPVADSDGDGVCDALDACPGFDDGLIGTACNDNDPCTTGETYDTTCGCSGGAFQDTDSDGVCDANDQCPGHDDNVDTDGDNIPDGCDDCSLMGQSCDDGDACTTGDSYDNGCNCVGTTVADSDGDGVCDTEDACPGMDDGLIGTACDDNDPCTVGEIYDANCGCTGGIYVDADGDGYCVGVDPDDNNDCVPASVANLALNKPSEQSSDYNNMIASRAVDGDNDGIALQGSISHTQEDQNAWWEVDLQSVADLSSIKIWNRTDCCSARLSDFHIFVSATPFSTQDYNATLADGNVSAYHFPGIAARETDITLNTMGRYVRIQLAGTSYLQLAEVEIFGCEGEVVDPCTSNDNDFETDFGIWNDGGSDCARGTYSNYASSGSYSVRIRDNSGKTSSLYSDPLDFSTTSSVTVAFSYMAQSMDWQEDFFFEISNDGGSTFTILKTWLVDTDFVNEQRYDETINIPSQYLQANTVLRFRCDASANYDMVYLDDIQVQICSGSNISMESLVESRERKTNDAQDIRDLIRIYPNPSTDVVSIVLYGQEKISRIDVLNLQGKQLESISGLSTVRHSLDLRAYSGSQTLLFVVTTESGMIHIQRVLKI